MAVKSRSAIPLFIFLAIALIFLPCAALLFICLRRKHQRRTDEKSRNEATDAVAESIPNWTAPIELNNIQPPPPVASIRPIRSLQTAKNRRFPSRHSGANGVTSPFDNSLQSPADIAVPKPNRPGERRSIQMQNMEYLAAQSSRNPFEDPVTSPKPSSLHTTHFNLQAALVMEQSAAELRRAGERSASISDAPRVKSQIVKPEHASATALEDAHCSPVPSVDAAYYDPRQVPKGWV